MIAVITADIINSTQNQDWQKAIEPNLDQFGESPIDWSIYRGDSIQLRIENPANALKIATRLKASIRQLSKLDIRIAIGIGDETLKTASVTQNMGSAYINSGRLLEDLPQNLAIKTAWEELDLGLNAGFNLYNTLCEQWTTGMSQYVLTKLLYPNASQEELSKKLNTTQSNVSRVLSRANYHALQQYLNYYHELINSKL